jgi:hypothetical protein
MFIFVLELFNNLKLKIMSKIIQKLNLGICLLMLIDLIYLHTTEQISSANVWVLYLIIFVSVFICAIDLIFDKSKN